MYKYSFNGKEKDDEVKGGGNSYDYGARIYDPRLGKWLSLDPVGSKYPMDSPFMFAGNSPINVLDPEGEEKIVIAASDHHDNTWKFLNSALGQLRGYRGSGDTRTLMLLNNGNFYSKGVTRLLGFIGKMMGFNVVSVANTKEMVDYMNGTTLNAHGLKRTDDLITDVDIFAHGTPGKIHSDYMDKTNSVIDNSLVIDIDATSFDKGATFTSYACRTGASKDLKKEWNPLADVDDVEKQIELNGATESLAQFTSSRLGIEVDAFMSRSEYGDIYGDVAFRKIAGDKKFMAKKGIDGKKGALYLLGAPFKVKGATTTGAVSPAMFKFNRGKKPEIKK